MMMWQIINCKYNLMSLSISQNCIFADSSVFPINFSNFSNPYKGKLFNRPHGKDLYKGLKIDYKGSSVTPDNFLYVLRGNASGIDGGNGRVLETLVISDN